MKQGTILIENLYRKYLLNSSIFWMDWQNKLWYSVYSEFETALKLS